MRVLIVDDDTYVRMILSIELPGVVLLEASSIADGLKMAATEQPDGVIVDRKLVDGDGLDLVRRIRKTFALSRIPIIVLTAGFDEAAREEVTRAGADVYLPKPFDPADLLDRIERVLLVPTGARRQQRVDSADRLRRSASSV